MDINDLPDDILHIILKEHVCHSWDSKRIFKVGLPLLSICRRWRQLALPVVYGTVFIQYGAEIRPEFAPGNINTPVCAEPENVEIVTNLDLSIAAGCANATMHVSIYVYYLANPFPGFRAVIKRMRLVASEWKRVQHMELDMCPGQLFTDGCNINTANHVKSTIEIKDALAALFPKVSKLKLCGGSYNAVSKEICGQLAGEYAEQLLELNSLCPIAVPSNRIFTRPRTVAVYGGSDPSFKLPRMSPEGIHDMQLHRFLASHSWAAFTTDSGSLEIEFPKLRRLFVDCCAANDDDNIAAQRSVGNQWVVRFPVLDDLTIMCMGSTCRFLEQAVLPPRVKSISITASSAIYQTIITMKLPVTKSLFLCIPNGPDNSAETLVNANRILEKAQGCKETKLIIIDSSLHVLPESITCADLTFLSVFSPTSIDTVLALIHKLPKLTSVHFDNILTENTGSDISTPDIREHTSVEPLDTNINYLIIDYSAQQYSPELAVGFLEYLLLRIPTLTRAIAWKLPKQPILDFVDTFSKWYPHLATMNLKVVE